MFKYKAKDKTLSIVEMMISKEIMHKGCWSGITSRSEERRERRKQIILQSSQSTIHPLNVIHTSPHPISSSA